MLSLAIQRTLEGAIVAGDGSGKPLGFLNGANLVTIAKETGQKDGTVIWKPSKMYHRILDKSKGVWLMHPDAAEQLDFRNFLSAPAAACLPARAAAGSIDTLRGKPIVESDHCSALGAAGDVNFVDLSQYMLAYKGGVDAATSIHVAFLPPRTVSASSSALMVCRSGTRRSLSKIPTTSAAPSWRWEQEHRKEGYNR